MLLIRIIVGLVGIFYTFASARLLKNVARGVVNPDHPVRARVRHAWPSLVSKSQSGAALARIGVALLVCVALGLMIAQWNESIGVSLASLAGAVGVFQLPRFFAWLDARQATG